MYKKILNGSDEIKKTKANQIFSDITLRFKLSEGNQELWDYVPEGETEPICNYVAGKQFSRLLEEELQRNNFSKSSNFHHYIL